MGALSPTVSPTARFYYLGIFSAITRRHNAITVRRASTNGGGTYNRSDFTNQPFTGIYEPGGPTEVSENPSKDQRR